MRAIVRGDNTLIGTVNTLLLKEPGVYCIFNSESNMLYIGCSNDVANRIQTHKRHLSAGEHICKQMNVDYLKNPSAFSFFCIEYIQSVYNTYEAQRSSILNRETQYMKRVPHTRLYNAQMPVSLSERLLAIECPAVQHKIPITEVCRRIGMSADSIRSNGFSMTDEITLTAAIEFVRKRTFANGRWAQDKADGAIEYLKELEAVKLDFENFNSESNETPGDLLKAGGSMDYFDDLVVSGSLVFAKTKKTPWILYGLMFVPAVASIQNMHSVTGDLTGLYSGWVLTILFSLAPFAFIVVGLRGVFVSTLTFLMIAYECFCNTMRIYGGLTRFGIDGYPTRFLGLVTDFCNSGTYATARVLSVFMALIAAGVFYAAYLQLNKNK